MRRRGHKLYQWLSHVSFIHNVFAFERTEQKTKNLYDDLHDNNRAIDCFIFHVFCLNLTILYKQLSGSIVIRQRSETAEVSNIIPAVSDKYHIPGS